MMDGIKQPSHAIDEEDDTELDVAADDVSEEEVGAWWTQLPDFIKPDYPFDIPPARLPYAREVFRLAGAPRFCALARCRRSGLCEGGDGPPCFRADRRDLLQVLFLWWMRMFADATEEECEAALRAGGNRYAEVEPIAPRRSSRSAKRVRR